MSSIIEALANASQDDLKEIGDRIADLERELDGLKAARKVIEIRLRGREVKARQKRTNGGGNGSADNQNDRKPKSLIAERIYDLIAKEGPLPVPAAGDGSAGSVFRGVAVGLVRQDAGTRYRDRREQLEQLIRQG